MGEALEQLLAAMEQHAAEALGPPDAEPVLDACGFMRDRIQLGRERYGQTLHTDDGRDTMRDLEEELADAIYYLMSVWLQGVKASARSRALLGMALNAMREIQLGTDFDEALEADEGE